jgi:hypothetical protein
MEINLPATLGITAGLNALSWAGREPEPGKKKEWV